MLLEPIPQEFSDNLLFAEVVEIDDLPIPFAVSPLEYDHLAMHDPDLLSARSMLVGETATKYTLQFMQATRLQNAPPNVRTPQYLRFSKIYEEAKGYLGRFEQIAPAEFTATANQVEAYDDPTNFSEKEVERFFDLRVNQLYDKNEKYRDRIEEWRSEYINSLEWASQQGLPINIDVVKDRITRLRIHLFDQPLVYAGNDDISTGLYYPDFNIALLDASLFKGDNLTVAKTVAYHEFTHAAGGVQVSFDPQTETYNRKRQGLGSKDTGKSLGNSWIDEATVEQLSLVLLYGPTYLGEDVDLQNMSVAAFFNSGSLLDVGYYIKLRTALHDILDRIEKDGINPLPLLYSAYFEDYEPGTYYISGKRQPERNNLFRILNQHVPLAELESIFTHCGSDELLDTINNELAYNSAEIIVRNGLTRKDLQQKVRLKRAADRLKTLQIIDRFREQQPVHS